jgi:hypothetical protein
MYLVDLVAVSLVSCKVMIVGMIGESVIRFCILGRAVLWEPTFHVTIHVGLVEE